MSLERQEEVPYTPNQGNEQGPTEQKEHVAQIPGLTEGRMVHYVLPDGSHRPAVVVLARKGPSGSCNLQVFLDGSNDRIDTPKNCRPEEAERGIAWRTSVPFVAAGSDTHDPPCPPHTWHWIEKA